MTFHLFADSTADRKAQASAFIFNILGDTPFRLEKSFAKLGLLLCRYTDAAVDHLHLEKAFVMVISRSDLSNHLHLGLLVREFGRVADQIQKYLLKALGVQADLRREWSVYWLLIELKLNLLFFGTLFKQYYNFQDELFYLTDLNKVSGGLKDLLLQGVVINEVIRHKFAELLGHDRVENILT
jgi:hypothetical protein